MHKTLIKREAALCLESSSVVLNRKEDILKRQVDFYLRQKPVFEFRSELAVWLIRCD